jgi:hypothetical protein
VHIAVSVFHFQFTLFFQGLLCLLCVSWKTTLWIHKNSYKVANTNNNSLCHLVTRLSFNNTIYIIINNKYMTLHTIGQLSLAQQPMTPESLFTQGKPSLAFFRICCFPISEYIFSEIIYLFGRVRAAEFIRFWLLRCFWCVLHRSLGDCNNCRQAGPKLVWPAAHAMWQCRGLSCMADPLTGVMPATCAMSRQRGWAHHAFLGAGATVQGTQLHGWAPHWCDARCSCYGTAAWLGPARLPGCWCYSAGDSAAWLGPYYVSCTYALDLFAV